jgi:hypothetical protein
LPLGSPRDHCLAYPRSSLDNPCDVLKAALGEIERHNEVRCNRSEPGQRVGGPQSKYLVSNEKFAKIDRDEIPHQLVGLVPVPDRRNAILHDRVSLRDLCEQHCRSEFNGRSIEKHAERPLKNPDEKTRDRFSRRGLNSCDDGYEPVICPTSQVSKISAKSVGNRTKLKGVVEKEPELKSPPPLRAAG